MRTNLTQIAAYLSIAIILISLFFIGAKITGFAATDSGIVNVTIATSASINFTTFVLDFGSGAVNVSEAGATINSEGTVTNGNWAPTSDQLVLENIGNVNVTLALKANKTANEFIGGDTPTFKAKVTNTTDHTTSCAAGNFTGYTSITESDQIACSPLTFSGNNSIDIDFELYIPNDAVGEKTVGIVATGTATS